MPNETTKGRPTAGAGRRAGGKPDHHKSPQYTTLRGETYWAKFRWRGGVHRESLRTTDREEAHQRVTALRKRMGDQAFGVPDERSFKSAVIRWIEEYLPGAVKPSAAERYIVSIRTFDSAFGTLLVAAINNEAIADWVSARKRAGRQPNGLEAKHAKPGAKVVARPLSGRTIARDLTALSSLLEACCEWGWRTDNPARAYSRRSLRSKEVAARRPPNEEEIAFVIAAAPAGVGKVLGLLASTGMRENEAVQMERWQVDSRSRTIVLDKTKNSRPRVLDWQTPGGDAEAALAAGAASGFLFLPDGRTEPYANFSSNFCQLMRRLAKEAEEQGKPFHRWKAHELRDAFALRWLRAGGSIHALSEHLGHGSVAVTQAHYMDWLSESQKRRVLAAVHRLRAEDAA